MAKIITLQRQLISFGIPVLMMGTLAFITKSTLFNLKDNVLAFGITVDLLLTIPFVYFLLIRKTNIPSITIVPFFIFGIIVASILVPKENQYFLNLIKTWVLPLLETTILILVIYKIRKAVKHYKKNTVLTHDFFTALKNVCSEILPKKAVMPFAIEIAVFYYGFIYWKKLLPKENEFTYHKKSGTVTLLIAILFIVAIEASVIHVLLVIWSSVAAWIMTILSLYSAIQIFGFLKSIIKRPISIEGDKLNLRYGILSEAIIDIKDIESIEVTTKSVEFNKETRKLSPFGDLESHNVIIKFNKEQTLIGFYGIRKEFKTLALHVDNNAEFKTRIVRALQQGSNISTGKGFINS